MLPGPVHILLLLSPLRLLDFAFCLSEIEAQPLRTEVVVKGDHVSTGNDLGSWCGVALNPEPYTLKCSGGADGLNFFLTSKVSGPFCSSSPGAKCR